jgi:hypothetical protein
MAVEGKELTYEILRVLSDLDACDSFGIGWKRGPRTDHVTDHWIYSFESVVKQEVNDALGQVRKDDGTLVSMPIVHKSFHPVVDSILWVGWVRLYDKGHEDSFLDACWMLV